MLVNKNKNKEPGDILVIKLTTGEEVVGEIVSIEDAFYNLRRPCRLHVQQEGLGLIPYSFIMDDEAPITFDRKQVVAEFVPSHDFAQQYVSASSNVEIARDSAIKNK